MTISVVARADLVDFAITVVVLAVTKLFFGKIQAVTRLPTPPLAGLNAFRTFSNIRSTRLGVAVSACRAPLVHRRVAIVVDSVTVLMDPGMDHPIGIVAVLTGDGAITILIGRVANRQALSVETNLDLKLARWIANFSTHTLPIDAFLPLRAVIIINTNSIIGIPAAMDRDEPEHEQGTRDSRNQRQPLHNVSPLGGDLRQMYTTEHVKFQHD
jgi:hypothetical protein